jgi:predicted DNA-binding transcriptional regulator YafY
MARPDRLFRLLSALRRLPAPVTAQRLAAETEVSLRTLYRDIATLRAGGALIDGAAGVGYTLTEDPALPPQMFTRLEVEALAMGLAEVQAMGDPDLTRAAADALAKVVATLPERISRHAVHATHAIRRFDPRAAVPVHMPLVRQAMWDERALDMTYADQTGALSQRRVWPLAVIYFDRALMLLAWCTLRQDFRRFHLGAMSQVAVTDVSFRPRRVPLLRDYRGKIAALLASSAASGRSR